MISAEPLAGLAHVANFIPHIGVGIWAGQVMHTSSLHAAVFDGLRKAALAEQSCVGAEPN